MGFIIGNFLLFSLSVVLFSPFMFSLADEFCKSQNACRCVTKNNSVIDLTPVGQPGSPRFHYITAMDYENKLFFFSYNPCYNFTEDNNNTLDTELPCVNVAACKLVPGKPGEPATVGAVGLQSTAVFTAKDFENINITYTLGTQQKNTKLTVQLKCDWSAKDPVIGVEKFEIEKDVYNITLKTKCACPDACGSPDPVPPPGKKGLSTGSGLLIAFFTIMIVYFVLGFTWNFCNGAHGAELVPNNKLWSELPQLIVDGFLFTCSCFTRKSQSSYSDM